MVEALCILITIKATIVLLRIHNESLDRTLVTASSYPGRKSINQRYKQREEITFEWSGRR